MPHRASNKCKRALVDSETIFLHRKRLLNRKSFWRRRDRRTIAKTETCPVIPDCDSVPPVPVRLSHVRDFFPPWGRFIKKFFRRQLETSRTNRRIYFGIYIKFPKEICGGRGSVRGSAAGRRWVSSAAGNTDRVLVRFK
ncbi:hypothetical protein GWI33_010554 [Rhynchophorus ferrugineus]|uniref:Uncharacterized protein n=1 Tax=Rhynchophorus ferrugineus TaxID=354439 RepID=A0A834IV09_RHYFE|nr:hypothetical protein GWI33_010554 [Rhynchophorus ferrugineus]